MLIVGGFLSFAGGLSTTSAKPDTTKHNPKINSEVSFFILSGTEKLTGRTIVFKPNELLPVSVAGEAPGRSRPNCSADAATGGHRPMHQTSQQTSS